MIAMNSTAMKVSVSVTTYNHVKYISRCLETILSQVTDFPFEVVVTDDCSQDGTAEIVKKFHQLHPDKMVLDLQDKNWGSHSIVRHSISACRGDYIAFVDGDDYFTFDRKLQSQASYLNSHHEDNICFHSATLVDKSDNHIGKLPNNSCSFSSLEELLEYGNFIPSPTSMIRRSSILAIPSWFDEDNIYADWALHVLAARTGGIGYLPEPMAAYRKYAGGYWSSRRKLDQWMSAIDCLRVFERALEDKYRDPIRRGTDKLFRRAISYVYKDLSEIRSRQGHRDAAIDAIREAIQNDPSDATSRYRLGKLLKETGRLKDAEAACLRAIELRPNFAGAHKMLSNIYTRLGQKSEAINAARLAVEYAPNNARYRAFLIELLSEIGMPAEVDLSRKGPKTGN